jgi:DNA-binding transcriptional MerR regulator/methylmalonyl-CoA mutase cobalamin-binding subunit
MNYQLLTISVVSEQTGISKEVLRKWETRYGFPTPERDGAGLRLYPPGQVRRLALLNQLLDDGMRPGQIVPLDEAHLAQLLAGRRPARAAPSAPGAALGIIDWLQANDPGLLKAQLQGELARRGLRDFVLSVMPALNAAVGNAWVGGTIGIKDEHLYVETIQSLLHQSIASHSGAPGLPCILLATPSGELHTLGLLMLEALMTLEGATCISLGAQLPLADLASASQAYRVDVVGLSFGPGFARKKIPPLLRELRALCPAHLELWAGGSGVDGLEVTPRGVSVIPTLAGALKALRRWRRGHLEKSGASDRTVTHPDSSAPAGLIPHAAACALPSEK